MPGCRLSRPLWSRLEDVQSCSPPCKPHGKPCSASLLINGQLQLQQAGYPTQSRVSCLRKHQSLMRRACREPEPFSEHTPVAGAASEPETSSLSHQLPGKGQQQPVRYQWSTPAPRGLQLWGKKEGPGPPSQVTQGSRTGSGLFLALRAFHCRKSLMHWPQQASSRAAKPAGWPGRQEAS